VQARIPGPDGTPVGHVYELYTFLCYKILQTAWHEWAQQRKVRCIRISCEYCLWLRYNTKQNHLQSHKYLHGDNTTFIQLYTFPTAALVKLQYEWLGHLQPEIIHVRDIPRRKSYYAAVIRLISSYYQLAHTLLYNQYLLWKPYNTHKFILWALNRVHTCEGRWHIQYTNALSGYV